MKTIFNKNLIRIWIIAILFSFSFILFACNNIKGEEERKKLNDVISQVKSSIPLEIKEGDANLTFIREIDGIIVSYQSDNEAVLSSDGVIHFPSADTFVTLTIKFSCNFDNIGEVEETKQVDIIVRKGKQDSERVSEILTDVTSTLPNTTENDLVLKTTSLYSSIIRYVSANNDLISDDGKVSNNIDNEKATLHIFIMLNGKEYGPYDYEVTINTKIIDDNTELKVSEIEQELYGLFSSTTLTRNIDLPLTTIYDSTVRYESSDEAILSSSGVVGENLFNAKVKLSFYFTFDGKEYGPYDVNLIINTMVIDPNIDLKLSEIEQEIFGLFSSAPLTSNIDLPLSSLYDSVIRYESSDESVLSSSGVVGEDVSSSKVTLSFYITLDGTEYGPNSVVIVVNTHVATNDNEYYKDISSSLSGNNLKKALRTLITTTQKRTTSYDEIKTVTVKTDADPEKEGNIILFYSRVSVSGKWDGGKTWNREHVWPRSKSWFQYEGAGSDIHHLRPTNPSINSSRGNKPYSTVTNSSTYGPVDEVKGDIARIVFYLLTRYKESDSYPITNVASSMKMLLEWNELDPVDNLELHRNEECYKLQGNRNPFIDYPDYAEMIWGTLDINVHEPFDTFITVNVVIIEDIKKRWG